MLRQRKILDLLRYIKCLHVCQPDVLVDQ